MHSYQEQCRGDHQIIDWNYSMKQKESAMYSKAVFQRWMWNEIKQNVDSFITEPTLLEKLKEVL